MLYCILLKLQLLKYSQNSLKCMLHSKSHCLELLKEANNKYSYVYIIGCTSKCGDILARSIPSNHQSSINIVEKSYLWMYIVICNISHTSCIISALIMRYWKTPQLHRKMCLAGISRHAHRIRGSSPLRVRHLAWFWLIVRCLAHDKEKKHSSCPKHFIPLGQIWSGTYLKKMLYAQEQVRLPYWIWRISWGVLDIADLSNSWVIWLLQCKWNVITAAHIWNWRL